MSLYMYKEINGVMERATVRPVAYQDHLEDGWIVDKPKLKLIVSKKEIVEPVKEKLVEMPVVETLIVTTKKKKKTSKG